MRVSVANGERPPCLGVYQGAAFTVNTEEFTADLFVLPLAGYDVVLGTRWAASLGPILWDFGRRTMAFGGGTITWNGRGLDAPPRHQPHALGESRGHGGTSPGVRSHLRGTAGLATPASLRPPHSSPRRALLRSPCGLTDIRRCEGRVGAAVCGYAASWDHRTRRLGVLIAGPAGKEARRWGVAFRVDYRALNTRTVKDAFPIPVVDELLDELRSAKYFTKLDLRSGYHQVRMHPDDVAKTAFRTHDGLYEFLVMPFGLSNAPATFQALMNMVLHPFLRRFVLVFFDDILIFSNTWTEHLHHVRTVLTALHEHELYLKRSKCSFGAGIVAYLGHVISEHGVVMDASKVQAVLDWPTPRSVRALRGFLGLAGYYRKFVKDFGAVAAPLTQLLKKEAFLWSTAATEAFRA
ncbi:hypothetical protein U9M48_006472 [Paspalum notatum var. saurae]|uniref:Reverse transcriptase domain-containing protein n=1 Tax=Paspalum notatum var. saurae TaxID=547442 RepID=A0AAQ3PZR6_PASNO